LSKFTNRSAYDHLKNPHPNVFVIPGGQTDATDKPTEFVGLSDPETPFYGTSFSSAYASGLVASFWCQRQNVNKSRQQVISELRQGADRKIPNFDSSTHGNGLIRLFQMDNFINVIEV
jgi:hypothetical protein